MNGIYRENLIISADDFGLNRKTNENILQLVRLGKLDRVSVMMGGELVKKEVQELLNRGIKLDIHLNVGTVADWNRKNQKKEHPFLRSVKFLLEHFYNRSYRHKIFKDWEAQIVKFKEMFGKAPDGLNSHEYLHFFPPYFKVALRLSRKHGIGYFRFGKSGVIRARNVRGIAAFILRRLWFFNRDHFKRHLIPSSDFLLSFDWMKNPEKFLDRVSQKVKVEVVFHPERDKEYEFLLRNS